MSLADHAGGRGGDRVRPVGRRAAGGAAGRGPARAHHVRLDGRPAVPRRARRARRPALRLNQ